MWTEEDLGPQWKHDAADTLVLAEPVVDLGCGSGVLLNKLHRRGLTHIMGVDGSGAGLGIVRTSTSGVATCLRCDLEQPLPFRDESFATDCLVDVLEHVFDPVALLREAARIAPEVVIVVPNFSSIAARVQVLLGKVPENNTPRKRHAYWFNHEALSTTIAAAGLKAQDERYQTLLSNRKFLGSVFSSFARARPQLFALSFAVRARRSSTS
jgi:SAM-dependent methyltransferase